jgi:hypothetical protein
MDSVPINILIGVQIRNCDLCLRPETVSISHVPDLAGSKRHLAHASQCLVYVAPNVGRGWPSDRRSSPKSFNQGRMSWNRQRKAYAFPQVLEAVSAGRVTPDRITTRCVLNITIVMEIGMFIVLFSAPPRYRHASSQQLAQRLRVPAGSLQQCR